MKKYYKVAFTKQQPFDENSLNYKDIIFAPRYTETIDEALKEFEEVKNKLFPDTKDKITILEVLGPFDDPDEFWKDLESCCAEFKAKYSYE